MQDRQTWKVKRLVGTGAVALALMGLVACQPVQAPGAGQADAAAATDAGTMGEATTDAEMPVVTITVEDGQIQVPAEVPSGFVAFEMPADPAQSPELARLNAGVTMEQINEAIVQPDPMAALALVTLLGRPTTSVDGRVIYDLQPGDHVAVWFPQEGAPVVAPFTAGEVSGATAPEADVSVQLVDFNFVLPDEISAGEQVWEISNAGQQWHEMGIIKLNEGVTVDDLMAMFASEAQPEGPPPFEEVVFWAPQGAGETAWVTWDLPAGEYTVICFLPDVAGDMSPHAAHGMVRTLVVK